MKLLALTPLLVASAAGQQSQIVWLTEGEDCSANTTGCTPGLCCGEAVNVADIEDGII